MIHLSDLWHTQGSSSVCGYLHHPQKGFLQASALAAHFSSCSDEAAFSEALQSANGCFAVILKIGSNSYAAVDRIRSIPLFWDRAGNLADKSEALSPLTALALQSCEPAILSEYLITGYVTGADTLHPALQQIPAGHYLCLEAAQKPILKCYYRYLHSQPQTHSVQDWIALQHETHLALAKDAIASLNGRAVVIPLSGGYDSRLLAYLFKKLNYDRIYTFSYDSPRHAESRISKRVARHLQLPWIFTEHTHKSWRKAYTSQARKDFYPYAVNASSSAHIQDWLALQEMQAKRLIPSDSVFMPGHSADFLQGSHLPAVYAHQPSFSRQELQQQIISFHYRLWPSASETERAGFAKRIQAILQAPDQMSASASAALFEYWDLQERQAKFIVNSLRVYESFGYQWRLPLWDARLMDYWASVPLELRVGRKLWQFYAQKHLRIPIPVYRYPALATRAIDKILRIAFGEIRNVRYGRFAEYQNPLQYARVKTKIYLRDDLCYPDFIEKERPLIRCEMNGIQALVSIFELRET